MSAAANKKLVQQIYLDSANRSVVLGVVGVVVALAFEAIGVATAMPVAARDLGGLRQAHSPTWVRQAVEDRPLGPCDLGAVRHARAPYPLRDEHRMVDFVALPAPVMQAVGGKDDHAKEVLV